MKYKRHLAIILIIVLSFCFIGDVYASNYDNNDKVQINSDETWVKMGTVSYDVKTVLNAYNIAFSAIAGIIPGGYAFSMAATAFGITNSLYINSLPEGRITVTQVRSDGPINSNTKIRTTYRYYVKQKSGIYQFINYKVTLRTLDYYFDEPIEYEED